MMRSPPRKLVIFGMGKIGYIVYRHIFAAGLQEIAGFTCDRPYLPPSQHHVGLPVVSFDRVTDYFPPTSFDMVVAIGYHDMNQLRRRKYEAAKDKGYTLVSYVSPRAAYGDWLDIGDNCIILDNAILEPGTRVGNNVIVWSGVVVGHHSVINDHCWIAGNSILGGSASLGACSFVGLGATIGNDVEVGEESFIGAGSLVTKCAASKSVFVERPTDLFRLDSEHFLRISKLR